MTEFIKNYLKTKNIKDCIGYVIGETYNNGCEYLIKTNMSTYGNLSIKIFKTEKQAITNMKKLQGDFYVRPYYKGS